MQLIDSRKIWDKAPHNAFTDLIRFRDRWFCVFREGAAHVSSDGAVRVLVSSDGLTWSSQALLGSPLGDVRDPKLSVTCQGGLMIHAGIALHTPVEGRTHQSVMWLSSGEEKWADPVNVLAPGAWLWRVTWHNGAVYGVGYVRKPKEGVCLYRSEDGHCFERWVDPFFTDGYPNEAALSFGVDDSCLCLLRRESGTQTAMLGIAASPYVDWSWQDLGVRIGGPAMILLDDRRALAGVRLYDVERTALCWLDPKTGTLVEALTLPSGGDTSYPGLVWHSGMLWVSYYSSHEGKTAIYVARVADV